MNGHQAGENQHQMSKLRPANGLSPNPGTQTQSPILTYYVACSAQPLGSTQASRPCSTLQRLPPGCIDIEHTLANISVVDIRYELNGTSFVWNVKKASANPGKHAGITFEQAATVLFDPFFKLLDASRKNEARDAVLGYDALSRLLFVVQIDLDGEAIRIISARKATQEERKYYDL